MSNIKKSNSTPINSNNRAIIRCYNCYKEIDDLNQKYCQYCNVILKPNDLKWRNSFILCISILCTIPILLAFLSIIMS